MKRYSVSRARAGLAEVLDLAEQGESVVIERRGVVFAVQPVKPRSKRSRSRASRIEILDEAIDAGAWSWAWTDGGLEFVTRAEARHSRRATSRNASKGRK